MIADIPDDWNVDCDLFGGVPANSVEELQANLKEKIDIQLLQDDVFTLIKSSHPVQSRRSRVDRSALTTLMRAVEQDGVPTIGDLAPLAMTFENDSPDGLAQGYLMNLVANQNVSELQGDGCSYWNTVKLYATLNQSQREVLNSGGKLPFASLSPEQHAIVQRMLFGSDAVIERDDQNMADGLVTYKFNDYRDEPTELLPNGLTEYGFIQISQTSEHFAYPLAPAGTITSGMTSVFGPEELAMNSILKQSQVDGESIEKPLTFDRFKLGVATSLEFSFHVAPGFKFMTQIRDYHFPTSPIITTEANLPTDFKQKIKHFVEEMQKETDEGPGKRRTIHP